MQNIDNKFQLEKFTKKIKPDDGKIHFIGLGGIGMSALAKILLELGYKISGSDIKNNQILDAMREQGATVHIGQIAENIENCSLVVVSTAIKNDNPELMEAKRQQLPVIHRSQLLEALISGLGKATKPVSIGVTGTHGKTTTTGMLTQTFLGAGVNPSFAIGGRLPGIDTNSGAGIGDYFIAELDESDGSIGLYRPNISIITNLEFDHADHYEGGFEQILNTFEKFVSKLDKNSKIIINIDDNGNLELLKRIQHENIIKYSTSKNNVDAEYTAEIITTAPSATFNVYKNNELLGEIALGVAGEHNVSNALSCVIASLECKIPFNRISSALSRFIGVNRRFQTVGHYNGARLVDDYAHHPTEVAATIKTARELIDLKGKGNVIAVFQPHRYSRLANLWDEFTESFNQADFVYIIDTYAAGESPIEGVNSEEFAKAVINPNTEYISGELEVVAQKLRKNLQEYDIVLTMGAGSITQLGREITEAEGKK